MPLLLRLAIQLQGLKASYPATIRHLFCFREIDQDQCLLPIFIQMAYLYPRFIYLTGHSTRSG